jgi:hypothetical protein
MIISIPIDVYINIFVLIYLLFCILCILIIIFIKWHDFLAAIIE